MALLAIISCIQVPRILLLSVKLHLPWLQSQFSSSEDWHQRLYYCSFCHPALSPVKMHARFWIQLSWLERVTVVEGGATGEDNGSRGKALAINHSFQKRFQQKCNKLISAVAAELWDTVETKAECGWRPAAFDKWLEMAEYSTERKLQYLKHTQMMSWASQMDVGWGIKSKDSCQKKSLS